jgi:hypothetical protein
MSHLPGRFGRPEFIPTKPILHDPISDVIGLSALISSLTGGALAVAGSAGAVIGGASLLGGALVGVPVSRSISVVLAR